MKKKLLFGIWLLSLLLLSSATVVQPVRGYEFTVPDEAVGVSAESEIKIYDEDEWEDHLGKGSDPTDFKDGDVDVVGARSKSHYTEIEKDEEIKYLADYYWDPDIEEGNVASKTVTQSLWNPLITPALGGAPAPFVYMWNYSVGVAATGATGYFGLPLTGPAQALLQNVVLPLSNATMLSLMANDLTPAENAPGYSSKWDGAILHREYWEPTEEAYDADPDIDDDEIPFMADPRDWYEIWEYTFGFQVIQAQDLCGSGGPGSMTGGLQATWAPVYYSLFNLGYPNMDADGLLAYQALNMTLWWAIGGGTGPGNLTVAKLSGLGIPGTLGTWVHYDFVAGVYGAPHVVYETIWHSIEAAYPSKAGLLMMSLEAGQPIYTPQDDFTRKWLEEAKIDDEQLTKLAFVEYGIDLNNDGEINPIPLGTLGSIATGYSDLGGETIYVYGYVDAKAEGGAIILEIEYQDGQIDPKDSTLWPAPYKGEGEDELDDWEWWFEYGDTGGSAESFRDGDTIFWQAAGVEQIPGFEVTVILGVSAISIIGLIYVVMKKRK